MTDLEFDQQIWRKHDRVMIQLRPDEAPFEQRVCSVSFWTRSVQVKMPIGGKDWIPFGCIIGHTTTGSSTEDCEIIENLHDKLMEAEKKLEDMVAYNKKLKEQQPLAPIADIRKALLVIQDKIALKKRNQEFVDKAIARLNDALDKMESNSNEE